MAHATLNSLPSEILLETFQYLDYYDRKSLYRVNKRFAQVINHKSKFGPIDVTLFRGIYDQSRFVVENSKMHPIFRSEAFYAAFHQSITIPDSIILSDRSIEDFATEYSQLISKMPGKLEAKQHAHYGVWLHLGEYVLSSHFEKGARVAVFFNYRQNTETNAPCDCSTL